jgi:response regulator RpfG family c-di-GMP phosphodiesterase/tRNA A-37 threonylcarbamoyl transferase component Bud32
MVKVLDTRPNLAPRLSYGMTVCTDDTIGAGQIIDQFFAKSWILTEDWEALPLHVQEKILWCRDQNEVVHMLTENNLLTSYQAARILAGTTFGLVLGSYRILSRIGAGGMAIVFKAEHIDLRHTVAIKVLPTSPGQDAKLESRFFSEMRVVAQLRHPNIVSASDAGRAINPDLNGPSLRYLVMEYVPGQDLEEYVRNTGPLSISRGCSFAYQVASALAETNKFNLVHRDIKPSNIMVTPEDQAKLLDFGLSRHFGTRLTSPGTVLGTIDFMAPEQARDSTTVDVRADLFSLGGVLFWCLTGRLPFPSNGSPIESLARRMSQAPPSLKEQLDDCPEELDYVVRRMMATDPANRYATPQAVMQALLPFLQADCPEHEPHRGKPASAVIPFARKSETKFTPRILIVDDEPEIRSLCRHLLTAHGMDIDEVDNGEAAVRKVTIQPYDLVLLDVNMPGMSGLDCLAQLRHLAKSEHMKIIMCSGQASPDEMSAMLLRGADDYLAKPFSVVQFLGRIRTALRLKTAQDRSVILNQQLLALNAELEYNLKERSADVQQTRNLLVLSLTRLSDQRDGRGRNRTHRIQRYCGALAAAAMNHPLFAGQIDAQFIDLLESTVPLHDIGKIALPDHILLKGGQFTPEERILMQTHTTIAADTLLEVAKQHSVAADFLRVAIDIIRHHHERFDGTGYPDGLVGEAIPLAARITAIADVYDALRCRRSHKPALAHIAALQIIGQASSGQFDPSLLKVLSEVAPRFEEIFVELPD